MKDERSKEDIIGKRKEGRKEIWKKEEKEENKEGRKGVVERKASEG